MLVSGNTQTNQTHTKLISYPPDSPYADRTFLPSSRWCVGGVRGVVGVCGLGVCCVCVPPPSPPPLPWSLPSPSVRLPVRPSVRLPVCPSARPSECAPVPRVPLSSMVCPPISQPRAAAWSACTRVPRACRVLPPCPALPCPALPRSDVGRSDVGPLCLAPSRGVLVALPRDLAGGRSWVDAPPWLSPPRVVALCAS